MVPYFYAQTVSILLAVNMFLIFEFCCFISVVLHKLWDVDTVSIYADFGLRL